MKVLIVALWNKVSEGVDVCGCPSTGCLLKMVVVVYIRPVKLSIPISFFVSSLSPSTSKTIIQSLNVIVLD